MRLNKPNIRRHFLTIFVLMQILLLGTVLYITGQAYKDMTSSVLEAVSADTRKNLSSIALGEFEQYQSEKAIQFFSNHLTFLNKAFPNNNFILAKYDSSGRLPIIWYSVDRNFEKYAHMGDVTAILKSLSNLEISPNQELKEFEYSLLSKREGIKSFYLLRDPNGKRYLLNWIIIPVPNNDAKYLLYSWTDDTVYTEPLDKYQHKYLGLFIVGMIALFVTLIILPAILFLDKWKN